MSRILVKSRPSLPPFGWEVTDALFVDTFWKKCQKWKRD